MKIIAFAGKKGSGKTTAAEYIKNKTLEYETGSLQIERINMKDALIQEMKERLPGSLAFLSAIYEMPIEQLFREKPAGMRKLMQDWGCSRREDWEDYWVDQYKERVKKSSANIVVTDDVRFPNELEAVQGLNGTVYRIIRKEHETGDNHTSETSLDDIKLPTIEVKTLDELYDQIDRILL
ncbi:MAG: hypothetical protein WDN67_00530 [Candidatus Moraniibacteriota bacterium]